MRALGPMWQAITGQPRFSGSRAFSSARRGSLDAMRVNPAVNAEDVLAVELAALDLQHHEVVASAAAVEPAPQAYGVHRLGG